MAHLNVFFFNQAAQSWMKDPLNVGRTITIHTIPKFIKYAFEHAVTPVNILSGYRATGIYPFDTNIIPEESFLPSFITDKPLEATGEPMC